jgi:hypothetical protein
MDNLVELTTMKPAEAYNPSNFKIGNRPSKAKSKAQSEPESKAKPESKRKSEPESKSKSEPQPTPEVDPGASGHSDLSSPAVEVDVQPANERVSGGMYRAENGDWMDDLSDPEDDSLTYDDLGLDHDYEIVDADDPEALVSWGPGEGSAHVSHSNGHKG